MDVDLCLHEQKQEHSELKRLPLSSRSQSSDSRPWLAMYG